MRMRVPETFVSNSCFIKRYIVIFLASGRIIGGEFLFVQSTRLKNLI